MNIRIIIVSFLMLFMLSCEKTGGSSACGTYNGKTLYKGSSGGCYYINSSGNKEYVDRSYCNC